MTDGYLTPEQQRELKEKEEIVLQGTNEYLDYMGGLLAGGLFVGAFFVANPPVGIYLLYKTAKDGGPSRIVKRWIADERVMEEELGPHDNIEKILNSS
jgi:hypothetical protein